MGGENGWELRDKWVERMGGNWEISGWKLGEKGWELRDKWVERMGGNWEISGWREWVGTER